MLYHSPTNPDLKYCFEVVSVVYVMVQTGILKSIEPSSFRLVVR